MRKKAKRDTTMTLRVRRAEDRFTVFYIIVVFSFFKYKLFTCLRCSLSQSDDSCV